MLPLHFCIFSCKKTPEHDVFSQRCFYVFSSFDRIYRLTGFFFDIDDFHFRAYGKIGMRFPGPFWGFSNKYKKSVGNLLFCNIRIFKIIKQIKMKGISHQGTNM